MRQLGLLCLVTLILGSTAGCGVHFSSRARNGITFYCPGAGNFDLGDTRIREGLRKAGYEGEVASFIWTISFNPAIDQSLRLNAKLRARQLSSYIEQYQKKYPGKPVHLVGLSAGTGIAVWALEYLDPGYKVDNVVLLGSSLWHRYDVSEALRHVKGKIYNYYSADDPVLAGPMKVAGTIDGKFGLEEGAGRVGLHTPRGADRVVNIAWKPEFAEYGNYGGHVGGTSAPFVQRFVAQHIIPKARTTEPPRETLASDREQLARGAPPD